MIGMINEEWEFETRLLNEGAYFRQETSSPEALPIHMATAHNAIDLEDLERRYDVGGYCYNRNRNPNRTALNELISWLEGGEASIACASGMAAISSAVIANTKAGDHILSDRTLYGESIEIFEDILGKYQVETTFADFTDLEDVKSKIQSNTVMLYTETVSNPMIAVPDLKKIADMAHENNAIFIVDNTFMTGALIQPLKFGADIVVNSLTKFANGHSDAVCGAVTGKAEIIKKIYDLQVLLGSQADPFTSWLICRGVRTLNLRIKKQSANALALAKALEVSPYVKKVFYPGLEKHPQHDIATNEFGPNYGGMLSLEVDEDRDKMNTFLKNMNLAHYAMTLGGYRTTLSYPPLSSHYNVPEKERIEMGITNGLLRISVGIEEEKDIVADFMKALEIAYGTSK
ncbi:MAG: PLP-dependent aspartate aminotransferase family protein [Eubacteriales bacterium]